MSVTWASVRSCSAYEAHLGPLSDAVFCGLFFLGSDVSRLMPWSSSAGWLQAFLCCCTIRCSTLHSCSRWELWCVRGWALPFSAAGWVSWLCLELGRDPDTALTWLLPGWERSSLHLRMCWAPFLSKHWKQRGDFASVHLDFSIQT